MPTTHCLIRVSSLNSSKKKREGKEKEREKKKRSGEETCKRTVPRLHTNTHIHTDLSTHTHASNTTRIDTGTGTGTSIGTQATADTHLHPVGFVEVSFLSRIHPLRYHCINLNQIHLTRAIVITPVVVPVSRKLFRSLGEFRAPLFV